MIVMTMGQVDRALCQCRRRRRVGAHGTTLMAWSLLSVLLLLLGGCEGVFRVVAPVLDNATAINIDHQLALFGRPAYGGNLIAPLALAPVGNRDGCRAFDPTELRSALVAQGIGHASDRDGLDEGFILLVERGHCHFTEKVRHAQAAAALGVVIYDTADGRHLHHKLPIMADDGTGGDIHIPSVMIHHDDAQRLMAILDVYPKTVVLLNWDVPRPDDRVEWSLWFSSRQGPELQRFIAAFAPVIAALGDSALFTPHYDVYDGASWGCARAEHVEDRPAHCPQLCLYDETICTYDPEKNNTIGLDGRDVLEEDVRQLCIYQHAQATANHSALFWQYLTQFNAQCSGPQVTATEFNAQCSQAVQSALGIPSMDECICKNGREFLLREVAALHKFHVVTFPELTVNDVPMYGAIQCETPLSLATCAPLRMICAGFAEGTAPSACTEAYWSDQCPPPRQKDECGECNLPGSSAWNRQCAGCDGVPHSDKELDECGVCGGQGSFDICGRCLPGDDPQRDKSCVDCKGVPNGFARRDACGVCDGHGSFDACGLCLDANDPRRQNYECHVVDDPDAVTGKMDVEGLRLKQFHGEVVEGFQEAVGFVANVEATRVHVKSVDEATNGSSLVVFFFVSCPDDACRDQVTQALKQETAALTVAMKMRPLVNKHVDTSMGHVALHSIGASSAMEIQRDGQHSWVLGVAIACAMTLAIGVVVVKIRDDNMRRDFQRLFSRYTPLTTMDFEEEHEYGGPLHPAPTPGSATAW